MSNTKLLQSDFLKWLKEYMEDYVTRFTSESDIVAFKPA